METKIANGTEVNLMDHVIASQMKPQAAEGEDKSTNLSVNPRPPPEVQQHQVHFADWPPTSDPVCPTLCYFDEVQNAFNCCCPTQDDQETSRLKAIEGVSKDILKEATKYPQRPLHCSSHLANGDHPVHCDQPHETFMEGGREYKKCTHAKTVQQAKKGNRLAVQKYRRKKKTEFENLKVENKLLKEKVESLEAQLHAHLEMETQIQKEHSEELIYLRQFVRNLNTMMIDVNTIVHHNGKGT